MCLSKAYIESDTNKELLMADVAYMETNQGKLVLETLFGDQKEIWANIKKIDFLNHSITLEKKD